MTSVFRIGEQKTLDNRLCTKRPVLRDKVEPNSVGEREAILGDVQHRTSCKTVTLPMAPKVAATTCTSAKPRTVRPCAHEHVSGLP